MKTFDRKHTCELCFAEKTEKNRCTHCDGISNAQRYPTALREGTILLGKYLVGRVLGKGGFGITYLCYDLVNDKKVAVKEFVPDTLVHRNAGETTVSTYGDDKGEDFKAGAQKFYEEARTVARFNGNPNIISVHEFFYQNNKIGRAHV